MSSTDFEPAPASAPEGVPAVGSTLRQLPRRYLALGLIVVVIFLLGALVLVRDRYAPTSSPTTETFNAVSSSLLTTLATVPQSSVYDAVGVSSPANPITPLRATSGSGNAPTWMAEVDGGSPEPVVFFYGAEFAPYAAAERWPLVLALSRFGTFRQLGLMQSSATTAFANVSTFTFDDAVYTSPHVILEPIERYSSLNPTGAKYLSLQVPDARQRAAISYYGSSATTFPLLDVGNRWVLNASSFTPSVLLGLTQDQIAGDLSSPLSPLTQAVISAANQITAAICSVDGQKPGSVCQSRGVVAADQALKITPPS
ncbi:MAG TPA: DUF929 family protein [Acidimicrobiales bacterium]|nr:DUF929 family protein [Acidimicrobiales bacterium]